MCEPVNEIDEGTDEIPGNGERVFLVTKEFREKLYSEFYREYAAKKSKSKGDKEPNKEADRADDRNKANKDKDPVKEKKVAQTR